MAKNKCIDFLRHKNIVDKNELKYFETIVFSYNSDYDTTYDELYQKLNIAIDNLSELQQAIIKMKLEGMDYNEISENLEISVSKVHKNIKKAYSEMRKQNMDSYILLVISQLIFMD